MPHEETDNSSSNRPDAIIGTGVHIRAIFGKDFDNIHFSSRACLVKGRPARVVFSIGVNTMMNVMTNGLLQQSNVEVSVNVFRLPIMMHIFTNRHTLTRLSLTLSLPTVLSPKLISSNKQTAPQ